jgi:hypothetical protein
MSLFSFPIKIHCWGGLGSQLFAVAMAKKCQENFPRRRTRIILHTGGVTYRAPEIFELFPEMDYREINDFVPSVSNKVAEKKIIARRTSCIATLVSLLKRILESLKLVLKVNENESFAEIRSWTISLRGHYAYVSVSEEFLSLLRTRLMLKSQDKNKSTQRTCGIHYRLGDLVNLDSKKPTPLVDISREFKRLNSIHGFDSTSVYTDSPDLIDSFAHSFDTSNIIVPIATTPITMSSLLSVDYFIGTSSKISFWIAAVRGKIEERPSSLPEVNRKQMLAMIEKEDRLLTYYGT